MIGGVNHIGLSVVDLQRSIAFYRDLFGLRVVVEAAFSGPMYDAILGLPGARGRVALLESEASGLRLELFQFEHPAPRRAPADRPVCDYGISHFSLTVSGIHKEYERLRGKGLRFHCPPILSKTTVATYARDPDGNVFELLEVLAP